MSEVLISASSVSDMSQEPARSVIFVVFSLRPIRYFMASSKDTGRFSRIWSSPAISDSLAYISLLILMVFVLGIGTPSSKSSIVLHLNVLGMMFPCIYFCSLARALSHYAHHAAQSYRS